MADEDIRNFFRQNEELIDQMNINNRWFLMMNLDEFGEFETVERLHAGDFSDNMWQAPTGSYTLEYQAEISRRLGVQVEFAGSEMPYYPLSSIAFIGRGLFPNVEFPKIVAAVADVDYQSPGIQIAAIEMLQEVIDDAFDELRMTYTDTDEVRLAAQQKFRDTIFLIRKMLELKSLDATQRSEWNWFLDSYSDLAAGYLGL